METRAHLLTAAERAVRARGFDAVSYADLAEEVGIRKASIHYHFPKKADLAEALIADYVARLAQERRKLAAHATGGAAIAGLIALYREALDDGRQLCLCVALAAGRDSLDDRVRGHLARFHEDSVAWLRDAFRRAREDGSIRRVSGPADEARAALALLEGAQIMARAAQDVTIYDAATKALRKRIGEG